MAEDRRRAIEQAGRDEADAEKRQRLVRLRMRLHELWQMLESDGTERSRFLLECETARADAFNDQLFELYKTEVARLADQLPLAETITRREFIKFRLLSCCCCLHGVCVLCLVLLSVFQFCMLFVW